MYNIVSCVYAYSYFHGYLLDVSALGILENAPLAISIILIISEYDFPSSGICCPEYKNSSPVQLPHCLKLI